MKKRIPAPTGRSGKNLSIDAYSLMGDILTLHLIKFRNGFRDGKIQR